MTESSHDENIEILTYSEIVEVKGFVGNFDVTIRKKPRYVDMSKCTGCGLCVEKCPTKVPSEWNLGMGMRKAIYKSFSQAVPNVPVIDAGHCTFLTKGKCKICQKLCPAGAIDYEQKEELLEKKFGAIIVATGFTQFDPSAYGEYGAGKFKNVITGLHLERMLDTSGPTGGHVVRPSDQKEPKNVVFIQCVGSRDESKGVAYCSRICCMYTAKQAILLKDHYPQTQSYIFYIDIRAAGKNYEEFVKRAQREYGAMYIRGRVSKIYEKGDKLIVRGADTLAGRQVEIEADLVVLASAVVPQPDAVELAKILNIPYDQYGFYSEAHPKLQPVESVTKGIFLTGSCQFPKDIPDSVATTGAASVRACEILAKNELVLDPKIASVRPEVCSGCLNCSECCPFSAIEPVKFQGRTVAQVNSALCHGCGNCASTCRTGALDVEGFTDDQIYAQVASVFDVLRKEKRLELSE
jgi:heterodisulfide reductase subunit A2